MARFPSLTAALLAAYAALTQADIYKTKFKGVTWDDDNWRLKTTELDKGHYQSRMSLANGYLGISVSAVGPFFEVDTPVAKDNINGWPIFNRRQAFATISGFWDLQPRTTNLTNFPWLQQYGDESIIAGLPHWSGLLVQANGNVLDASVPADEISDFSSMLDIHSALLTWKYKWTPPKEAAIDVEYSMFVHKLHVNRAAVQLKLTPTKDMNVTVVDVFDGDCAVRSDAADKGFSDEGAVMWSAVKPNGIDYVTAYVYSSLVGDDSVEMNSLDQMRDDHEISGNKSTIAQSLTAQLSKGQTSIFAKFIGGASTDAFHDPQYTAKQACLKGAEAGFEQELSSHKREWHSIMSEDTVDDFRLSNGQLPDDDMIIQQQITAVTNPFNLLQNTVGPNAVKAAGNNNKLNTASIQVSGLGSDSYGGMIFWDADVWMQPGLTVAYPEHASAVSNYRVAKYAQAQKNIKTAYQSSKNNTGRYAKGGAVYPWTSGRFGNCTATGPCFDYEYHLNGDIGLAFLNYLITTGDEETFEKDMFPIYDDIASLFSQTLDYNKTSSKYVLRNATDPDEYANHVDNAGFTMTLTKTHLATANLLRHRYKKPINKLWMRQSRDITIPVNEEANLILEYNTMNGSIEVKQADVVLIDDFLDYPNPYSLSNLDYYAGQQSLNGPGMTYGVFSIVANAVAPSGCSSYTYDLYGSDPYVRAPWFQYSEQLVDNYEENGGTHPAFPFLTGMGGANRVAVYGYLGLRLHMDSLRINPALPPQIPSLKYRTIYWYGHAISAHSNQTHTTLSLLPSSQSLSTASSRYAKAIPVTVGSVNDRHPERLTLKPSTPLVIKNRMVSSKDTWKGNQLQCQPATSPEKYTPGQFPLAAVDGAISTIWQPDVPASHPAILTVPLVSSDGGSEWKSKPIRHFRLNWARHVPQSFSILFHNSSKALTPTPSPSDFPLSQKYLSAHGIKNVTSQARVAISAPFDPKTASEIRTYEGNETDVRLDEAVWSGRYASLVIQGSRWGGGEVLGASEAATVAEFGILYD